MCIWDGERINKYCKHLVFIDTQFDSDGKWIEGTDEFACNRNGGWDWTTLSHCKNGDKCEHFEEEKGGEDVSW